MLHFSGGFRIGNQSSNNVINIGGQRSAAELKSSTPTPNSVGEFAKAVEQQGVNISDSSSDNVIQIGPCRLAERKSAPVSTPTHTPDTVDEVVQQPQPARCHCMLTNKSGTPSDAVVCKGEGCSLINKNKISLCRWFTKSEPTKTATGPSTDDPG
jgi:hypothetical protein